MKRAFPWSKGEDDSSSDDDGDSSSVDSDAEENAAEKSSKDKSSRGSFIFSHPGFEEFVLNYNQQSLLFRISSLLFNIPIS